MLLEARVDHLMFVEKDPDYVAVWQTALGADAPWLIDQILALAPRRQAFLHLLGQTPTSRKERALHTLVKTWGYHRARLTKGFGFLPDASAQGGGASLGKTWRPQTLTVWIRALQGLRRRITVQEGCGIEEMAAHATRRDVFIYADPPYPTAGQRMYIHGVVDIPALLARCQQAQGPVVVSREDHVDVVSQAEALGLECMKVDMHSATNQQMRELLISNRPLPHALPTTDGKGSAQLELAAD
jgi:hypothetical protein